MYIYIYIYIYIYLFIYIYIYIYIFIYVNINRIHSLNTVVVLVQAQPASKPSRAQHTVQPGLLVSTGFAHWAIAGTGILLSGNLLVCPLGVTRSKQIPTSKPPLKLATPVGTPANTV